MTSRDVSPLGLLPQVEQVDLPKLALDAFRDVFSAERLGSIVAELRIKASGLQERAVIHINSTAKGGGVAEMLAMLVPYMQDLGINASWLVIKGDQHFFEITKRIHNGLHGFPGDGGALSLPEERHFEKISEYNAQQIAHTLNPGDIVVFHDPQTAGMIPILKKTGILVFWRCHVGADFQENHCVERAWKFLQPFIAHADKLIFTKEQFVPKFVAMDKVSIIYPSISAFSPKNQVMSPQTALAIVQHLGIVSIVRKENSNPALDFIRLDGKRSQVHRFADILHAGPLPNPTDPMILQISRWDRLKDMSGVMRAFVDFVLPKHKDAYLVLAGPSVHGVSDDPEGAAAYNDCISQWRSLPHFQRARVQLVCLPMRDVDENAAMVNALQTHATIITQKSLQEGFGLTVTEALWKRKPVVASAVGGIKDQIQDGINGLLLKNPRDLESFGHLINDLLDNTELRNRLAEQGHEFVLNNFLATRHLMDYLRAFSV
jgi:trehalose synthase